jgi:hypothetical protein
MSAALEYGGIADEIEASDGQPEQRTYSDRKNSQHGQQRLFKISPMACSGHNTMSVFQSFSG